MGSNKKPSDTNGAAKKSDFDPLTAALRRMHDSVASEAIPDDFLILLDQIDAKMSAQKNSNE